MKPSVKTSKAAAKTAAPSGPVYFFGLIGALVYYIQVAHGFGSIVFAFLKAVVWPAFLIHDALKFIAG